MAQAQSEAKKLKIAEPYPSSPQSPPAITIYFQREGRFKAIHTFGALYSAKAFLDIVIASDDIKWDASDELITESGVTVKCSQLEELIEYTPTKAEAQWQMDDHHKSDAESIRTGKRAPIATPPAPSPPTPEQRKQRKEAAPKVNQASDGLITIAQLAEKLKLEPSKARAILRKNDTPKPYAWTADEAKKIEQLLAKGN